jgi:UDP-N-acetylglucosamine--N-acetylmuramyl-(pentapeptide) pyrophosphoryl-undecaprenol N-acetylglucosamine transferase
VIYVTVGTHQQPFQRLLDALIDLPADELVVQFGYGSPPSGVARAAPFMSFSETLQYIAQADAVVTHAGVGSILCARRAGHVPVVVPRLRRHGEHVDDHQAELARALAAERLVIPVWDTSRLTEALEPVPRRSARFPVASGGLQRAVREALL